MANEFIIKNGFHSKGNSQVTGSLTATSFSGDGSGLTNLPASSVLTSSYTSEWILGADGTDHYTFSGPGLTGAENDPDIYLVRGQKYRFYNNSGGHPFRIQSTPNGSAGTAYNDGVTNNDAGNGTYLLFDVQFDAPTKLYYQCTSHGDMGGPIYIADAIEHSGSFSGSFQGDGSSLTGLSAFPFTGDAQITGSLLISGSNPKIEFDSNVIIGNNAIATSSADISIGTNAITAWSNVTYKNDARIAIGLNASASEGGAIAIGDGAVGNLDGVAVGKDAGATTMGQYAVAIGKGSQATTSAVAIGRDAIADGTTTTAIGNQADAGGNNCVAIGNSCGASGHRSVAIGDSTGVTSQNSVGIGYNADVTANGSIAIGGGMSNSGQYSIILGSVAWGQARANSDVGAFVTYLNNESTPSLKFQINSGSWWAGGGNFGFGTKTPGSTLAVSGSFTTTGSAIMSSSNSDIALSVQGSGSTVFNIIGSEGTLFAIEDDLDGTLFTVNDRSGIPMFEVSASGRIVAEEGESIIRSQRPMVTHTSDFSITSSLDFAGKYHIVGGSITCSINTGSLVPTGAEFEFFQTSSAGNFLFITGSPHVDIIVKNDNMNLAGQGSGASLKYIGGSTFHLVGDLT
jgi:hypothetical protein